MNERMVRVAWVFWISKHVEFFDTVRVYNRGTTLRLTLQLFNYYVFMIKLLVTADLIFSFLVLFHPETKMESSVDSPRCSPHPHGVHLVVGS